MENNKKVEEIKLNLFDKEKEEFKEKFSLSCNLKIDQPKLDTMGKKEIKFNTIISDPEDEHPDSHLWE